MSIVDPTSQRTECCKTGGLYANYVCTTEAECCRWKLYEDDRLDYSTLLTYNLRFSKNS